MADCRVPEHLAPKARFHVDHESAETYRDHKIDRLNVEQPPLRSSLLGGPLLGGRGNAPVHSALMQQMQGTYGNRAVQRFLHLSAGKTSAETVPLDNSPIRPRAARSLSVQRCGDEVHAGCPCADDQVEHSMRHEFSYDEPVHEQFAFTELIPVQNKMAATIGAHHKIQPSAHHQSRDAQVITVKPSQPGEHERRKRPPTDKQKAIEASALKRYEKGTVMDFLQQWQTQGYHSLERADLNTEDSDEAKWWGFALGSNVGWMLIGLLAPETILGKIVFEIGSEVARKGVESVFSDSKGKPDLEKFLKAQMDIGYHRAQNASNVHQIEKHAAQICGEKNITDEEKQKGVLWEVMFPDIKWNAKSENNLGLTFDKNLKKNIGVLNHWYEGMNKCLNPPLGGHQEKRDYCSVTSDTPTPFEKDIKKHGREKELAKACKDNGHCQDRDGSKRDYGMHRCLESEVIGHGYPHWIDGDDWRELCSRKHPLRLPDL